MPRRDQVIRRSAWRRWTRRFFGIVATGVVLAVGVVAADMVMTDDETTARPFSVESAAKAPKTSPQARAVAVLRRKGYRPVHLSDYHADHTLRVLVGTPLSGDSPRGRKAFFFAGKRYIGTDASTASLRLRTGRQLDREITLVYTIFEPGDTGCCPTGGVTRVRFRWTGSALRPREAIPAADRRLPPE